MLKVNTQKASKGQALFVSDSADLIGDVVLHKDSNVWFGAVLRADIAKIELGEGSNIQDGCVCHVDLDKPVLIGKNVTIGHNVTLHGCKIGDNSLVGMGAVVLDGAEIGENCLIGAGAVVTPGAKIPSNSMVLGAPGSIKRELKPQEIEAIVNNARIYVELAKEYGSSKGR